MPSWLNNLLSSASSTALEVANKTGVVVRKPSQQLTVRRTNNVTTGTRKAAQPEGKLPLASIIYGIAASILLVAALGLMISGAWVSGLLVLLPSGCFVAFALHFIKHQ